VRGLKKIVLGLSSFEERSQFRDRLMLKRGKHKEPSFVSRTAANFSLLFARPIYSSPVYSFPIYSFPVYSFPVYSSPVYSFFFSPAFRGSGSRTPHSHTPASLKTQGSGDYSDLVSLFVLVGLVVLYF